MADARDVTRIALSLEGTIAAPHFDRTAFKVVRIFATLGEDGSLNLKLTPDEQEFRVLMAPEIFSVIPNAWGGQGWTAVDLAAIGLDALALRMAWAHGRARRPGKG